VFDAIRRIKPGAGDEIQLTDALALMLSEGVPVHGLVYRGMRYDTGLPLGYLQAVVQIAAKRPDLGPAFTRWLTEYVKSQSPD
jgi:UTP--glucose-1-phosphate uridylyltransferase